MIQQLKYVIKDPDFFYPFALSSSIGSLSWARWLIVTKWLPPLWVSVSIKSYSKAKKKKRRWPNWSKIILLPRFSLFFFHNLPTHCKCKFPTMGHMATPRPITCKGNRIHPIMLGPLLPSQNRSLFNKEEVETEFG